VEGAERAVAKQALKTGTWEGLGEFLWEMRHRRFDAKLSQQGIKKESSRMSTEKESYFLLGGAHIPTRADVSTYGEDSTQSLLGGVRKRCGRTLKFPGGGSKARRLGSESQELDGRRTQRDPHSEDLIKQSSS